MKKITLAVLVISIILTHCGSECKIKSYTLNVDFDQSLIADTTFYIKRVTLDYLRCDTLIVSKRIGQDRVIKNVYYINGDLAYECKIIKDFKGKILGVENTLALAKKDTSNIYEFNVEKYPPVVPRGSDNYHYEIRKISNNEFLTIKKNLQDTVFQDLIYYDSAFIIHKIIIKDKYNTYQFVK